MEAVQAAPPLRYIPIESIGHLKAGPSQKIRVEEDLDAWRTTTAYQDYSIFLRRLNESVVGIFIPWSSPSPSQATTSLLSMLDTLDRWIEEIPPLETPQRFGNLAFRTWGRRLEDEHELLLQTLLSERFHSAIPHLAPYLLISFGSFTRMDYGTGHETSFALFLLCLTLIRVFEPEPEVERQLVLTIFLRYLRLCWKLQDVYRLEPAGSHGVWGLDDYSFLPYIFGSAQLRDQTDIPVSAVIHPPLPPTNLYFMSISRILDVKQGPFFEHSSQLYNIATGVKYWSKVNSGLFKMYEAEVLGKRVVVQHIPLGGLLEWNPSTQTMSQTPSSSSSSSSVSAPLPSVTAAPWASNNAPPRTSVPYGPPGNLPTGSFPTTVPPILAGTSFVSPRPHLSDQSGKSGAAPSRYHRPIVPDRMPLGPLASTAHRPTRGGPGGASVAAGPTTTNTQPPPSAGDE